MPLAARRQPGQRLQRLLEALHGFAVGAVGVGLGPGLTQVVQRLVPHAPPHGVIGQPLEVVEPIAVMRLQLGQDPGVEPAPLELVHAGVGHLVGQRVPEGVLGLDAADRLVDELGRLQLGQAAADRLRRQPGDGLQHRQREVLADDGRRGQQPPRVGRQPVDARQQHVLHGVGHDDGRAGLARPAHGAGQLLQEERVALGLGQDHLHQRRRHVAVAQHRLHDAAGLVGIERLQRDVGGVRLVDPRRPVAGTIGRDDEHRRAAHRLRQRLEELARGGVHPVQVLDHQHARPLAAAPAQQLAQDLEDARLERLVALHHHGVGAFLHAEEVEQVGRQLAGVEAGLVERAAHLLAGRLRRVGVDQAAGAARQIEHG